MYQRVTGFFSTSAIVTWASILPLMETDGSARIQLVAGPYLSPGDLEALGKASSPDARAVLQQSFADNFVTRALDLESLKDKPDVLRQLLLWMIANGHLELRFGFPDHVSDGELFHEKIGVFTFSNGDKVAFQGSANETMGGHSRNYESVDVYRSWIRDDADRVAQKQLQFNEVWSGESSGITVLPLSKQVLDRIAELAPKSNPAQRTSPSIPARPAEISAKWRHQDDAVREFFRRERGILEMATGTGKTRTALSIARELICGDMVDTVVVSTDGTDLLNQWSVQLLEFARSLPQRYILARHYDTHYETERFILNPVRRILIASRYALPAGLRALSRERGARTLLIHDEVHNLGSEGNREALGGLSAPIRFRLGLSATPEREYDSAGTAFINDHVGPVIFRFSLEDAIRRGILAPFDYYPLAYTPDEDDRLALQGVHKAAAGRQHAGSPMSQEEIWTMLARVYKLSRAKLPIFRDFIEGHPDLLKRCIVFVETREYGDEVLEIVHRHRHDFHTYYSGDESETLLRFARGELECLLTCHRLSQGIDIQSLSSVILFSSARARLETIQRMGRCLRIDPANPTKRASVVDFIRDEEANAKEPNADQLRKQWLTELSQIAPEE
jgi:superfamily II DNA or RNA helicase